MENFTLQVLQPREFSNKEERWKFHKLGTIALSAGFDCHLVAAQVFPYHQGQSQDFSRPSQRLSKTFTSPLQEPHQTFTGTFLLS